MLANSNGLQAYVSKWHMDLIFLNLDGEPIHQEEINGANSSVGKGLRLKVEKPTFACYEHPTFKLSMQMGNIVLMMRLILMLQAYES